jgi:hypothetical protein
MNAPLVTREDVEKWRRVLSNPNTIVTIDTLLAFADLLEKAHDLMECICMYDAYKDEPCETRAALDAFGRKEK